MNSEEESAVRHKGSAVRLGKCWHGADHTVIFQAQPAFRDPTLPKRFYLIGDPNQATRGFRFVKDKPENLKTAGMAANMIRKHLGRPRLADIIRIPDSLDLWAVFVTGRPPQTWGIRIDKGSPPELSLVDPMGDMLFRIGKKGAFTKKRSLPDPPPGPGAAESLTEELLEPLRLPAEANHEGETDEDPVVDEVDETTGDEASQEGFSRPQIEARQRLTRRLRTAKKSLDKAMAKIPSEDEVARAEEESHLLQTFSYLIKPGNSPLILRGTDLGLEKDYELDLPTDLAPGKIIESAFARTKKLKKQRSRGLVQNEESESHIALMNKDLALLKTEPLSLQKIQDILVRHKIPVAKQKAGIHERDAAPAAPYRTFRSADGAEIRVGRSAADSDMMTKQAKSNDYWLHCIGITGSHIIIPFNALPGKVLSPATKREAAILAVHFSKVREDRAFDVYFTRKQNIRKPKGLAKGLWLVDKSDTLFVKYDESELRAILDRLVR